MAADPNAYLGSIVSGTQSVGFTMVGILAWAAVVIIFSSIAGVVTWMYVNKKKFKHKIIVRELINNNWQITRRDRAAEMPFGTDGTTVFYLKKHKKTIPPGTIQISPNTYMYKITPDKEWVNVPLEENIKDTKDLLEKYQMHTSMRYNRTALQKRMQDRYEKKPSWLAQNWTWIAGISFVMVLAVSVFLLFDKWIELAQATNVGVEMAAKVLEKADQVLARVDSTCTASGYVKVDG